MKKSILLLGIISFVLMSLTNSTTSENCRSFYPLKKGTKWVYNEYNKKDKLETIETTYVKDVKESGGKTEFVINSVSEMAKPKKDDVPHEFDYSVFCDNGILTFDMSSYIPAEYNDMDITVEQTEITIPAKLEAGMTLPDAQVIVYMSGVTMMQIDITNRKIERMETVTTEAGTFDCVVMTNDLKSKVAFITFSGSNKTWYSPNVGEVMSETYDKNGKKIGSRKLVEFSEGN